MNALWKEWHRLIITEEMGDLMSVLEQHPSFIVIIIITIITKWCVGKSESSDN